MVGWLSHDSNVFSIECRFFSHFISSTSISTLITMISFVAEFSIVDRQLDTETEHHSNKARLEEKYAQKSNHAQLDVWVDHYTIARFYMKNMLLQSFWIRLKTFLGESLMLLILLLMLLLLLLFSLMLQVHAQLSAANLWRVAFSFAISRRHHYSCSPHCFIAILLKYKRHFQ